MTAGSAHIAAARAPFVMFEKRGVEDRDGSIKEGRYIEKDVDYALITPAGSKDQIERIVTEWFAMLEKDVKDGRFPGDWLRAYRHAYKEWQEGNELPLNGTPIKTWAMLSPAQRSNLLSMKVMTVEDLAAANEEIIRRLGMGGRALKQQAVDYLSASNDGGKVASELSAMRVQLEQLAAQNEKLQQDNARLLAQLPPEGRFNAAREELEVESAGGLLETREVTRL